MRTRFLDVVSGGGFFISDVDVSYSEGTIYFLENWNKSIKFSILMETILHRKGIG